MSGWVVPGFTEERELGSGASGRVVTAVHEASGAQVAVKYLSPALFGDPGFLAAFRAEAQLLRSLASPHVVRLFDYVEEPGRGAAIVMELVRGVSLHEMITRQGPAGPEPALVVLKGSLLGLAAAHALGIVHRDYKPENVLVDAEGISKLTDFGIAARAGQGAPAGGTPYYMAPEQWDGTPASPAADIYAATAVFFECLTVMTPFSGGLAQLAAQHAAAAVPVAMVDEPLRELIARGMAKDPAARPASAAELVTELESAATAACGQDWESRGQAQLAGRAAALLLLLHGSATTVASGTGTTNVTTTLSHARRAAHLTRRALTAGHGTGGVVAAAVVAAAVTVALLPAGHKGPAPARAAAPATINGAVYEVAATSDSNIWAVGCGPRSTCNKTLTMHWNGTSWAQVPSPSPGNFDQLTSVAAVSASNVWAVGYTENRDGSNSRTLIVHWNGTAWTQVPSPSPAGSQLLGVAFTSADDAWAVGYTDSSGVDTGALILHWNGTAWTQVPSPAGVLLHGVTAISARSAWAVGYAVAPGTPYFATLILRWNGTTWARVSSPSPGHEEAYVDNVAAASDSTAWALGATVPTPGVQPPLLMRWDGSTWQTVPLPGAATSNLTGLAATSAGIAWAVGCTGDKVPGPCINSLMLQWNGTGWTRVQTPAHGAIWGVYALSATDVVAVGARDHGTIFIMRWNGKTWN
jgi:hypothetical protein